MSYRVDIPTLSANEVYTLTFEYEGTETIQLIVGDLTLETTDRRVVFTTTSPVNYIESNVKLENLDLYEGYYESDDFGGEYTQESYIEGMSLVNLKNKDSYHLESNWYRIMEMTEDGYKRVTQVANDRNISCFYLGGDSNKFAKNLTGEKYTVILDVRKNTFPSDVVFEFCMCYSQGGSYEKLDDDIIYTGGYGMYKKILGGEQGRAEALVYNTQVQTQQLPDRYWGTLINVTTQDGLSLTNTLQGRTDMDGCVIEYIVTVVEGDYYGQGIEPFTGIGCVKSPKIVSIGNTQGFGKGGRL